MGQLKKVTGMKAKRRYPHRISIGERSINFTVDSAVKSVQEAQSLDVFEDGDNKLVIEFYPDRNGKFSVNGTPRISNDGSVGVTSMSWPLIRYMHYRLEQCKGKMFDKNDPLDDRQFLATEIDATGRAVFEVK